MKYMKKNKNAKKYYDKSLDLLKKLNNKRGISELYNLMGELEFDQNNINLAKKYIHKGQELAISMELTEDVIKNYKLLSTIYEKNNEEDKALIFFKKFVKLKDSLFNAEKHKQLSELESRYKTQQKEQQIKIQEETIARKEAELIKQETQKLTFIGLSVLLLIFGLITYNFYQNKRKANQLLTKQKNKIENFNNQITSSINYAKRIQQALLPELKELEKSFNESFVFWKPRDIVSGDFYWHKSFNQNSVQLLAVADCTGHGVPGAFVSMLGIAFLNEIVLSDNFDKNLNNPAKILEKLRFKVKKSLRQTGKSPDNKDGMDIAMTIYHTKDHIIYYSGANRPLYHTYNNNNEVAFDEFKATRNPIGTYPKEISFKNNTIHVNKNDCIYMFSDGFADQFGGEKGTKYKTKRFKVLLKELYDKQMNDQKDLLENEFYQWGSNQNQSDDILIVGFRI